LKTSLPKVAIVILNWNGLADTVECLDSLKKVAYPNYEVVVIDNGSRGNDVQTLKEKYRESIIVISNKKNEGFAGGCNIGIKWALENNAAYVFLLNNDTTVSKDFLRELVEVTRNNERIGIVGPKVYYYDRPNSIATAGGKINFWTGNTPLIGRSSIDHGQFDCIKEVDFVSGCALLIKVEAIRKIGMLDERYFAYYEETDLCARAKRGGWQILFVPNARIWHKGERSVKSKEIPTYYMTRNRFLFMKRNARGFQFPFFIFYFLFTDFILKMEAAKLFRKPKLFNAYIKGAYDGMRIALGTETEAPRKLQ
jgi:GT2 family glycosyltransferase